MKSNSPASGIISWTIAIAVIALIGLVMLILFGNLSGNVGFADETINVAVTNETGLSANLTGELLSGYNSTWSTITVTSVWQAQAGAYNVTVPTTNVSVSAVGVIANATNQQYSDISVSYTYVHTFDSLNERNTESVIGNYSSSVTNTTAQLPVVGTIIGVALLLLILIGVLVFAVRKLSGLGSTNSSNSFDSGGASFG